MIFINCLKENKLQLIGLIFIGIVGTLLHFTYEWSGNNFYVGLFSAVNESVFEHLKLGVFANLIFMIYEHTKIGDNRNYITSKLVFSIIYIIVTLFLAYIVREVFNGSEILYILTYYIAVYIAQNLACNVLYNKQLNDNINIHSRYLYLILIILFFVFTIYPPFTDLFRDSITNTYGIFNLEGSLNE